MSEDFDVDELGFQPAVSATGAEPAKASGSAAGPKPAARPRRSWRRRLAGVGVLFVALVGMGGTYAAFADTASSGSNVANGNPADGEQLFNVSCITCHGANLQGVTGRGPSLIGVGSASVYFQVSTGRMPATQQGAVNDRKPTKFTSQQIEDLAAFVQSLGGGPQVPSGDLRQSQTSLGEGGELFRLNCASCHGTTGKGAPLSAGGSAPSLRDASDAEIYAAMLTGPENMPVFSDNQLTPDQKKAIIDYVQTMKEARDPGGNGIDRIGPVSEGLVIWVVGIGAVVLAILWIGAKS